MRVRYSFSSRKTRLLDRHNQHRNEFPALVTSMVEKCNIILEVLDSRFLEETRNIQLENLIKERNKKIIYILNKADLVDKKTLKEKIPANFYPFIILSCKERKGGRELRDRIKMIASKIPGKVNIGVVGYPNTGKSSIINLLVGRASARTSAEAGFTKGIQEIKLSSKISILDTPGVIPQSKYSMQDEKKIFEQSKVSARSWDNANQPELIIHSIMFQYPGVLEKFYNINCKGNSEILIEELAKKRGFLSKGNKPDVDRTARFILKEWQEGKIKI